VSSYSKLSSGLDPLATRPEDVNDETTRPAMRHDLSSIPFGDQSAHSLSKERDWCAVLREHGSGFLQKPTYRVRLQESLHQPATKVR